MAEEKTKPRAIRPENAEGRRELRPGKTPSIPRRLALLVSAITVVGLLTGIIMAVTAYRSEKASVLKHLEATSRALASAVDMQIRDWETLLRTLSTSTVLARTNLAAFHRVCQQAIGKDEAWIVLDDGAGQQLLNTRVPFGTKLPNSEYTAEEIEALSQPKVFASDVFAGPLAGKPEIFIGVPIRRGESTKFLTVGMFPEAFGRALSMGDLAPNGTIALVDRQGVIIARNKNADRYVGGPATPDMVAAVRAREEGLTESVTKEGVPVFVAISRSQASEWSVLMAVSQNELLASARRLLLIAGALLLLLLIFAAGISAWIGRSLIRAVNGLVETTDAIARGERPVEIRTGIVETDFVSDALHQTLSQISDRERELAAARNRLEELVAKRSEELAAANRKLAIANRDLETFAHIAVHDLREPLRTINAFSGSLREDFEKELPADARLYTDRIENAAMRMSRLLESIFAYAKMSGSHPEPASVSVNAVLNEVLQDLDRRVRDTQGRVVAGDLGWVRADPAGLHQLLLNLIGNALKFHREGVPPVVELESGEVGSHIHLVVKDNGVGFDPRFAEKIFSPFERLETARRFEGTGMGLAIVRRIAERQGGSVHASSVPGEGSRFVVILRAAKPNDRADQKQLHLTE